MAPPEPRVERFSLEERAVHWLVAACFLYAALTGLSLWSPSLYWLAGVLGGGETVRWGHPWGGVLFAAALGWMFRNWARQMRLDRDDREWLRNARAYAVHSDTGLPEAGRFNAGQKVLFWAQAAATVLLLASGAALWFPATSPRWLLESSVLVHPVAALVSLGGIIVHVYMGTAGVPGAFRSMVRGWVTPAWAAFHHPKWFRQVSKR